VPPLPASGLAVAVHPPPISPVGTPPGSSALSGYPGLPPSSSPFDPTTPTASGFSRHSHISLPIPGPPPSPDVSRPSTSKRSTSISHHSVAAPSILADLYPAIDQLDISLNNLRAMHSSLLDEARRNRASQPTGLSDFDQYRLGVAGRQSSEAATLRGDEQKNGSRSLGAGQPPGANDDDDDDDRLPALRTHQRAASTSSRLSSVLSIWYDAEVMPEVDERIDEAEEDAALARFEIPNEDDSSSGSSDDDDDFEEAGSVLLGPTASPRGPVYARSASLSASDSTASSLALSSPPATEASRFSYETARPEDSVDRRQPAGPAEVEMPVVQWRTRLPVPMPKDEGSLISVLRKSVGKDMSQISMPVTFNEAISLLQRAAEDIEYSNLLTL
jgi:hypothetical protein